MLLRSLIENPLRVASVARDEIPELLGQLETLRARLLLRLSTPETRAVVESDSGRLLTVADAAERLELPPKRVYDLVQAKKLPHVRIGRQIRFSPIALAAWIEKGGEG